MKYANLDFVTLQDMALRCLPLCRYNEGLHFTRFADSFVVLCAHEFHQVVNKDSGLIVNIRCNSNQDERRRILLAANGIASYLHRHGRCGAFGTCTTGCTQDRNPQEPLPNVVLSSSTSCQSQATKGACTQFRWKYGPDINTSSTRTAAAIAAHCSAGLFFKIAAIEGLFTLSSEVGSDRKYPWILRESMSSTSPNTPSDPRELECKENQDTARSLQSFPHHHSRNLSAMDRSNDVRLPNPFFHGCRTCQLNRFIAAWPSAGEQADDRSDSDKRRW